jgi:membrane protein
VIAGWAIDGSSPLRCPDTSISNPGFLDTLTSRLPLLASFRRAAARVRSPDTTLAAAGVAFYILWAFFPALTVTVVLLASTVGPKRVLAILAWVRLDLPDSINAVVVGQLVAIARSLGSLSLAAYCLAGLVAIWASFRGALGLMTALNGVYQQQECRPLGRRLAVALLLAILSGALITAALAMLVVGALGAAPGMPVIATLVGPTRWPPLFGAMFAVLAMAFRYGPCRRPASWRSVTAGAGAATAIWISGTFLFAWLAALAVGSNPLLGSLSSIVLFLLWLYLTVIAILFGANVDAGLDGTARP